VRAGRSCGYIFTDYTTGLIASVFLIAVALFSVLLLTVLACSALCCPGKGLALRRIEMTRAEAIEITPAFGVSQATVDPEYRTVGAVDNPISHRDHEV
jgi:hypothetical protein